MLLRAIRSLSLVLGFAIIPSCVAAQPPLHDCPADRAIYRLQTDDGPLEIGFIPAIPSHSAASDLYLYLTTAQRTYWFGFSVSNGYSGMTLLPVSDPHVADAKEAGPRDLLAEYLDGNANPEEAEILSSLRFYSLDADFTFLFVPPMIGDVPPAYIMVPEIGLTLWYTPQALTEDGSAHRDPIPRGIFELAGCRSTP